MKEKNYIKGINSLMCSTYNPPLLLPAGVRTKVRCVRHCVGAPNFPIIVGLFKAVNLTQQVN